MSERINKKIQRSLQAGGDGGIKAGIIGAAGYTGGELIRLLIRHPYVAVSFIHSRSNAGNAVASIHQDLIGETDLIFSDDIRIFLGDGGIDVLFLCVGPGEAKKFLSENEVNGKIKIIDLTQDFRLHSKSAIGNRKFVYGLPELNKEQIKSADSISNPGCFATCIQLGLLPLAKAKLLKDVYSTGITGSTGAGQSLSATSHFSWRANNIQPYKTLTHQHLGEVQQSLHQFQNTFPPSPSGEGSGVRFVPWRGDFTRGIFITSQLKCEKNLEEISTAYNDFYSDCPFTIISSEPVSLKQVINTNKCVIQLEKVEDTLVVHSAIDNLLKGASGQAVQNMNLMFGFDECAGLKLKAVGF
ncbi:MAG: N-acetyl-gamma-glutamyl-phosphate reductase [Chitinophagaceae bacterium]